MTKSIKATVRAAGCVLLFAGMALLSGCATRAMKGTPFYTGEYEVRQGPAEDRVNLWPLLYYRDPALSVLWPLVELTEDHFAVRPVMSVYGLREEEQVYNVLWPIGCFDQERERYRVFPYFWGDDYRTLFPLYWHQGEPFGEKGGYDRLFPLWSYESSRKGGYNAHVLWPFFHRKDYPGHKGGRVWPLYGSYERGQRQYRFFGWPLGHQWRDSGSGKAGSILLPLYSYERDRNGSTFMSLPYSHGETYIGEEWDLVPPLLYRSSDRNRSMLLTPLYSQGEDKLRDSSWDLLLPVYYSKRKAQERVLASLLGGYRRTPESLSWLALPLLSGGRRSEQEGDYWFLGPMAHVGWDRNTRSQHVFPLYYRSEDSEQSLLLTLPWSSWRDNAGGSWQFLPPVFYHSESKAHEKLITPLYSLGRNHTAGTSWDALFPLYYREQSAQGDMLATLLGGYETDPAGKRWLLYPLLSGGSRDADGGNVWVLAPFLHAKWNNEGATHHLMPLYYWNGWDKTLVSPLAARWRGQDSDITMVPPLLSLMSTSEKRSDLWGLGGMAHLSWGAEPGSQHVLPLFYSDPRADTFVSAVAAMWPTGDGGKHTLIPPALSWMTRRERRSDLWLLGCMAHLSWGEDAQGQHVLPVCYWNRSTGSFISPLFAGGNWDGVDWRGVPLLLSAFAQDGDEKHFIGGLGLFHQEWGRGPDKAEGHLVPVYYYSGRDLFLTPLFGWRRAEGKRGFFYPLTPLLGLRTGTETGSWLFPLHSHRHDRLTGRKRGSILWGSYNFHEGIGKSGLFPVFSYRNRGPLDSELPAGKNWGTFGTSFRALLLGHRRNETRVAPKWAPNQDRKTKPDLVRTRVRSNGLFPLWGFESRTVEGTDELHKKGSVLLLLGDYKREIQRLPDTGELNDYTRSRVLWRLWHYERLNGEVTVDLPGITYDSRPDGFRQFSFLWRVFRYEKGPEGKKLDIIIPLVRTRGATATEGMEGTK